MNLSQLKRFSERLAQRTYTRKVLAENDNSKIKSTSAAALKQLTQSHAVRYTLKVQINAAQPSNRTKLRMAKKHR